jgi:hypothetical protein
VNYAPGAPFFDSPADRRQPIFDAMPYIRRDASGQIVSLHRQPEPGAVEFVADEHADVQAFVGRAYPDPEDFARLDADFVRVLEDVIDTLVARHVINITDLPPEAQVKLFSRKGFRERRARNALELFGAGPVDRIGNVIDDTNFGELL